MKIKKADFLKSVVDHLQAPETGYPEYAFIGRSNVGKSSLINMLTNRSSLAKISVKPGKTQTINYFLIDEAWYMVDLPGYGWARVSKEKKLGWSKSVRDYLLNRKNLTCLFTLVDSRLDPQAIDIEFINWAGTNRIPLTVIFTKADKLSKTRLKNNISKFSEALAEYWASQPPYFISSATDRRGQEEILDFIGQTNIEITGK